MYRLYGAFDALSAQQRQQLAINQAGAQLNSPMYFGLDASCQTANDSAQDSAAADEVGTDTEYAEISCDDAIGIWVFYHLTPDTINPTLQLTFIIEVVDALWRNPAYQIDWQEWDASNEQFQDYLWEHSCLECFIGNQQSSEYVEVNASPAGAYALYHFTDYRTPALMPPRRLNQLNYDKTHAHIRWSADVSEDTGNMLAHQPNYHRLSRQFSVDLNQLPQPCLPITVLHPCVVLLINDVPLYFAPQHASPPDFHNRKHWASL